MAINREQLHKASQSNSNLSEGCHKQLTRDGALEEPLTELYTLGVPGILCHMDQ